MATRPTPPTDEIIEIITPHVYASSARPMDDLARTIKARYKTTVAMANKWLREALTDPSQQQLCWIYNHRDDGVAVRVIRGQEGSKHPPYRGVWPGSESDPVPLYLDRDGGPAKEPVSHYNARDWCITSQLLNHMIGTERAARVEERRAKMAKHDADRRIQEEHAERLYGPSLAKIRGLLSTAQIDRERLRVSHFGRTGGPDVVFLHLELHDDEISKFSELLPDLEQEGRS